MLNDSIGILEQILSFVETADLLSATAVSRRWRGAGRSDPLWQAATQRLWRERRGVYCNGGGTGCDATNAATAGTTSATATTQARNNNNLIFWRALYNKERVRKMSEDEVRCLFQHPLLTQKLALLEESLSRMKKNRAGGSCTEEEHRAFLERFVQLHMLDVMSDTGVLDGGAADDSDAAADDIPPRYFFADLSFGSYACSVRDSRRRSITPLELCTPFGFEMFFKVARDDVVGIYNTAGAARVVGLRPYSDHDGVDNHGENDDDSDDDDAIMLYRHGKCFFESEQQDRQVRLEVRRQNIHSYYPSDLKWRWIEAGKLIKVGPYPVLTVSRRKDWGWRLENALVVMYSLDGAHGENDINEA